MRITLELLVDAIFFETEDAEDAEGWAEETGGKVYSWKTTGKHNWLESGYSRVDVAGLVVMPLLLPDTIRMTDDPEQD